MISLDLIFSKKVVPYKGKAFSTIGVVMFSRLFFRVGSERKGTASMLWVWYSQAARGWFYYAASPAKVSWSLHELSLLPERLSKIGQHSGIVTPEAHGECAPSLSFQTFSSEQNEDVT